MALLIPFAFVLLCLVKKLTVIGIIGKTQGVSNAANPDKKAMKKIDHNPLFVAGSESRGTIFSGVLTCSSVIAICETTVSTFTESTMVTSVATAVVFETAGIANVKFFSILIQTSLHT